jgi:hypothetical protein
MSLYLYLFALVLGAVLLGGSLLLGTTARMRSPFAFVAFAVPAFGMVGVLVRVTGAADSWGAFGVATAAAVVVGLGTAFIALRTRA